jgi:hypothetical protein
MRQIIQPDGSIVQYVSWFGDISRVINCRWESLHGEPRVTAFVRGQPDTFFSVPAYCHYNNARVYGYLTGDDDGNIVFRHTYHAPSRKEP